MTSYQDRIAGAPSSLAFKAPCRVATTANITLSGFQTLDGVLPTASEHPDLRRVLVKNQTDSAANGIYIMDTGAWERAKDFDGTNDFRRGTRVFVWGGNTAFGGYVVTSTMNPLTFEIDEDDITFTTEATVSLSNFQFADGTGLLDDSGNEQLILQKTASAVNYLEITNSAAGTAPQLSANGSDTAVDLKLTAKSSGVLTSTSAARFDAAITSTAITASGAITANAAITSTAITASGLITANAGITSTSVTVNGPLTSTAITASGAATFNAAVASSAITASGLITANAGITSTAITANGAITSTAVTASGVVTANAGLAQPVQAATSGSTGTTLNFYGYVTITSSSTTTWNLAAPSPGRTVHIQRLSTTTGTTNSVTLESGTILTSTVSTATSIAFTGAGGVLLQGLTTALATIMPFSTAATNCALS